eukprot:490217-Prymnesium_polylepis.1
MLRSTVEIAPNGAHTHTVILLHGMYDEGNAFEQLPDLVRELVGNAANAGIKYIFPTAPLRTVHWPTGVEEGASAWYGERDAKRTPPPPLAPLRSLSLTERRARKPRADYFTCRANTLYHDVIDETHLNDVAQQVIAIIDAEVALLAGDSRRVLIGGNSQGGTLAGHVALTYAKPLGALIFLRSCLLDATPVEAAGATPTYVFAAEYDTEYSLALQRKSYGRLRDVTWHVEEKCDHYMFSKAELYWAAAWIGKAAIGERRVVTYVGAPCRPAPHHGAWPRAALGCEDLASLTLRSRAPCRRRTPRGGSARALPARATCHDGAASAAHAGDRRRPLRQATSPAARG